MPGTIEGARKAAETKLRKYGADHFKTVGAKGGYASKGRSPGFASDKKDAQGLTLQQRVQLKRSGVRDDSIENR